MRDDTSTTAYWDAAAGDFDDEPDHGLRDPAVREAWAARLRGWLPERPGDVLDLGCGTGSLALLAAEAGHRVTGVDRSSRMARLAREKLAGTGATVLVGDAAEPPVPERSFDVVLVRHLLWLLPDQEAVLRRWVRLLRPGGRLVLIEGRWGESDPTSLSAAGQSGSVGLSAAGQSGLVGLSAAELSGLVGPLAERLSVEQLGPDAALWGRVVRDERYVLVADLAPARRHAEIVDVHLILRRGGEVLLARRANTGYADGLLHAPSGHVEDGEDVRAALLRETAEEIGITLAPDEVRAVLVMQHKAPTGAARTGWFFEAELGAPGRPGEDGREPVNREPEKCSELGWFPLDALPDDMVAYCRAGLDAYRAGHRFTLHWHEPGDPIAYDPAGPDRLTPLG
ncbi:methyltransferase domain-containing protein [Streptomyces sp. SRF1]|uniref:methyltransferase domain-containing protein n=1 Tax=Streptomyces sp. SRF1 TaxID=1549642 RepID=UPI0025B007BE|nr:methyltransferase domain-containing protein [Streptomyces sp. SRF1]MDN3055469.1 methyltransferase domain-containing protein [Streptomyces sp. SRF1]